MGVSRLNALSIAAATALVLGLPSFVARPSARQGSSQFRAGVDLVAVDLLAVDDQGRPIADLRPANLQLKIDGRPRDIRQLEFIKVARTSVETSWAMPSLPAPFATNASDLMGRLVVLVVDEEHIRPGEGKPVLDAAARFLDRLAPTDRVALVTLPTDTVRVDATTNRDRVRQSLSRLVGKAPRRFSQWNIGLAEAMAVEYEQTDTDHPNTQLLQNRECRFASSSDTGCNTAVVSEALRMAREEARSTRDSLRALTDLLNGLSRIEEPKTLVLMSGSLVVSKEFQDLLEPLVRAASLARAQLYVVQPQQALMDITGRDTPTSVFDDDRTRGAGLADLASYAGGLLFQVSGTGDDAFRRIGDEISAFYLLGFKPESSERDGKRHKIELTSLRPSVTLRARPMFVIGAAPSKPAGPLEPRALVRDLSARRDLTLRAAAYAFRAADRAGMKVIVVVETVDPATTLNASAFALIDPAGRVVREWTEEGVGVVVRPIVTATEVPPGEYKLRVGAIDTQGRRGAADYEFRAALDDASPMQLNVPAFGGAEQGTFRPALVIDREVQDATGYMEIYGAPPAGAALAVVFEVAATPDGPALVSSRATILATKDADRRVATAAIPIRSLTAGDYAGRAVVTLNGKVIGRVWRTVRKGA